MKQPFESLSDHRAFHGVKVEAVSILNDRGHVSAAITKVPRQVIGVAIDMAG